MRRFPLFAAVLCLSLSLSAEAPERGDLLSLKIAVMGPGDQLYSWWGHIALVVEDAFTGENTFYDYGIFSFEAEHFFRNFALGHFVFRCGASPAEFNYRGYRMADRDIVLYSLDLPAEAKLRILRFVENNVRPENRYYNYHHFRDNCSTRIRDIIDFALDGRFREAFGAERGRFTLRQNVRRHTWFSPFFDWFLSFLMGQGIDRPTTVWEEMFLPEEVGRRILEFSWVDGEGVRRPLVSTVEVLNRAAGRRPAVLAVPRRQWPRELAFGIFLALPAALFYGSGRKKTAAGRALLGLYQALLGLFFGMAGSLLFFMGFFTAHDYSKDNINLLFVNPLLLAALPLGLMAAFPRPRAGETPAGIPAAPGGAAKLLRLLWTAVFCGAVLSLALRALPWFWQQNQVTLAMLLPLSFALGPLAVIAARRAGTDPPPAPPAPGG